MPVPPPHSWHVPCAINGQRSSIHANNGFCRITSQHGLFEVGERVAVGAAEGAVGEAVGQAVPSAVPEVSYDVVTVPTLTTSPQSPALSLSQLCPQQHARQPRRGTQKPLMGGGRRTHRSVNTVSSPISVGMVPLSELPLRRLCPQQHARQPRRGTQNTNGWGASNSQLPKQRHLAQHRGYGAAQ